VVCSVFARVAKLLSNHENGVLLSSPSKATTREDHRSAPIQIFLTSAEADVIEVRVVLVAAAGLALESWAKVAFALLLVD
jgi:hypothetical protein